MRNKILFSMIIAAVLATGVVIGRGSFTTFEQVNNELGGAVFVEIQAGEKGDSVRLTFQPYCPPPFSCVNKTLAIADVTEADLTVE